MLAIRHEAQPPYYNSEDVDQARLEHLTNTVMPIHSSAQKIRNVGRKVLNECPFITFH